MSAVIKIETDNPALEALLNLVIAKALSESGFTNAKTKMVSLSGPVHRGSAKRIDNYCLQYPMTRDEPKLVNLDMHQVPADWLAAVLVHNRLVLTAPVLLDGFKDTCVDYETESAKFLGK